MLCALLLSQSYFKNKDNSGDYFERNKLCHLLETIYSLFLKLAIFLIKLHSKGIIKTSLNEIFKKIKKYIKGIAIWLKR